MEQLRGQLTLRSIIIGCVGCAILTASSVYVALKMGALPWPIIFAAIVSLFILKAISRGNASLNEANVTHTVMSSGAMVAGGLAFTIPGIWMIGLADEVSFGQMIFIAIAGSALGLIASIALSRHFIEDAGLEFPIGQAAAQTLKAGDAGGKTGLRLFASMGFAGIYTLLRDGLHVIPSMLVALPIPGVTFGIYNSPMMLSVGFLVGIGAVSAWFLGALVSNFGIVVLAPAAGWTTLEGAQAIASCLGMGAMMGAGIGVIVRDIIPKAVDTFKKGQRRSELLGAKADVIPQVGIFNAGSRSDKGGKMLSRRSIASASIVMALLAVGATVFLGFPIYVSVFVVLAAIIACAMSAQSVGQTGIDPMEIFGLIVLLLVLAFADLSQVRLFFIAALVAVACGLAGDVMNDFKAGAVLRTSPTAQWVGQGIGAIVGSVVAVLTMQVLLNAFGADAFGVGREFVSAQASVVASLVSGIANAPAFAVGLVLGIVLYLLRLPSMMFGLGLYLPFYMSLTAFLGSLVKVAYDRICKVRAVRRGEDPEEYRRIASENGLVVASGLLGGESVVGILLALIVTGATFMQI